MLNRVSGPNFTGTVIKDENFKLGVKEAKRLAGEDFQYEANEFANAIDYLEKDGTNDTFSIQKRGQGECSLLKNGVPVNFYNGNSTGRSVMRVFIDYVKFNLGQNIAKPFTPTMDDKVKVADINNRLTRISEEIAEIRNVNEELRGKYIHPQIQKELHEKLDTLI